MQADSLALHKQELCTTPRGRGVITIISAGEVTIDVEKREVWLSKIFKWYAMDFGTKEDLLRWLVDYTSEENSQALNTLLKGGLADGVRLKYNDYDWGQNSA